MDLSNPNVIDFDTAEKLYGHEKGCISELRSALFRFQQKDRARMKARHQTCMEAKSGDPEARKKLSSTYGLKVYTPEECRKLQEVSTPPRARRGKRPFILKNAREER